MKNGVLTEKKKKTFLNAVVFINKNNNKPNKTCTELHAVNVINATIKKKVLRVQTEYLTFLKVKMQNGTRWRSDTRAEVTEDCVAVLTLTCLSPVTYSSSSALILPCETGLSSRCR